MTGERPLAEWPRFSTGKRPVKAMTSLRGAWAFLIASRIRKLRSCCSIGARHGFRKKEWKQWTGPLTLGVATAGGDFWWTGLTGTPTINAITIFRITGNFLSRMVFGPISNSLRLDGR